MQAGGRAGGQAGDSIHRVQMGRTEQQHFPGPRTPGGRAQHEQTDAGHTVMTLADKSIDDYTLHEATDARRKSICRAWLGRGGVGGGACVCGVAAEGGGARVRWVDGVLSPRCPAASTHHCRRCRRPVCQSLHCSHVTTLTSALPRVLSVNPFGGDKTARSLLGSFVHSSGAKGKI